MAEKLPVIKGKDLIKFFLKYGCEVKELIRAIQGVVEYEIRKK